MIPKNIVVSSKRKTAIGKATIKEGTGKIIVNKRDISSFSMFKQLQLKEPILIAEKILGEIKFDIKVKVTGGGIASQIEAARLAMARAIVTFTKNEEIRKSYLLYDRNILVADTRRREAYKPGDSKARAKRQTSYR